MPSSSRFSIRGPSGSRARRRRRASGEATSCRRSTSIPEKRGARCSRVCSTRRSCIPTSTPRCERSSAASHRRRFCFSRAPNARTSSGSRRRSARTSSRGISGSSSGPRASASWRSRPSPTRRSMRTLGAAASPSSRHWPSVRPSSCCPQKRPSCSSRWAICARRASTRIWWRGALKTSAASRTDSRPTRSSVLPCGNAPAPPRLIPGPSSSTPRPPSTSGPPSCAARRASRDGRRLHNVGASSRRHGLGSFLVPRSDPSL
mmetsp:Transcript_918/g.3646  ORF Transcript_918/g.3646 Transcript_918/m.3646 type:complete len:261 (-) Transcript_918:69-851(-)